MKRYFGIALASLALAAQGASAQTAFLSVGGSLPTGEFADYANTGWLAQGGVGFPAGPAGLSIGVSGFYGVNNHEAPPDGDKTNEYGAGAYVLYNLSPDGSLQPYLFAGPSYLVHSYKSETFPEDSASGLAGQVGGGVNFPLGGIRAFAEGMYTTALSDDIDGTDFMSVSLGVDIPLGG